MNVALLVRCLSNTGAGLKPHANTNVHRFLSSILSIKIGVVAHIFIPSSGNKEPG